MAKKWKDIRKGLPRKPLTPEEHQVQLKRLARLDEFCEGLEPTGKLLELADRYTAGSITFAEFESTVRSWAPESETLKAPDLDAVFAALDAAKLPDDFLSEADRDRRPDHNRPDFDLDLVIGPTTEAALEYSRSGRVEPVTLKELRAILDTSRNGKTRTLAKIPH